MNEQAYFEQFVGDTDPIGSYAIVHASFIHKYYPSYHEAQVAQKNLQRWYPDEDFILMPTDNGIPLGMFIFPMKEFDE